MRIFLLLLFFIQKVKRRDFVLQTLNSYSLIWRNCRENKTTNLSVKSAKLSSMQEKKTFYDVM